MTAHKLPPISPGTSVKTTVENHGVSNWTEEARVSRRWGVQGTVVKKHQNGHGLSYEVAHFDGTVGYYDPTELERI